MLQVPGRVDVPDQLLAKIKRGAQLLIDIVYHKYKL